MQIVFEQLRWKGKIFDKLNKMECKGFEKILCGEHVIEKSKLSLNLIGSLAPTAAIPQPKQFFNLDKTPKNLLI